MERVLNVAAIDAHAEEQAMLEEAAAQDGVDAEKRVGEGRVVGGGAFEVEVFNGAQASGSGIGRSIRLRVVSGVAQRGHAQGEQQNAERDGAQAMSVQVCSVGVRENRGRNGGRRGFPIVE